MKRLSIAPVALLREQRPPRFHALRAVLLAGFLSAFALPAFAQAPVANDDNAGTGLAAITEGGSINGTYNVLDNDTNAPTTATIVTEPSRESEFTLNADGTFTYTHNGTETSSDSFTYQASNGEVSNIATVTITINNTNDAPVLTLNGANPINLGTGDPFSDPGASATDEEDNNNALTNQIVVGGDTVNTSTPGSYTITYNVTDSDGAPAPQITRTVNVTDDDAPVITLNGANPINLAFGQAYNEPGATATDNVDNSVTVVVGGDTVNPFSPGTYTVTYNAQDSAGNNAAQVTRTVNVAGNNAPTISLIGPATITINLGGSFVDPGATASDPEDGNITASIVVGGDTVNPNSAGTYVITYNVQDSAGNPAPQVTRTVIVSAPPVITGQAALSTPEDTALLLVIGNFTVSDPDTPNDQLTLQVLGGANYTVNGNTITPAQNYNSVQNGDLTVSVVVNDGTVDSEPFDATVEVTPVNDPPVISGQDNLVTDEDASLTILIGAPDGDDNKIQVTDPDNGPGDFTLTLAGGQNYSVNGTTVTPDPNFSGTLTVRATVSDGELSSAPRDLTVTVRGINDDPMLESEIPDQVGVENQPFSLNITGNFSDADGDSLRYTATGLPPSGNITFNGVTGVFSGTPRLEDARDNDPYIIQVTATDRVNGSTDAVDEFNLNISALDRANVSLDVTATPNPAMVGDQLRWTFTARNTVGPQAASSVELNGSFVGTGLTVTSTSACTIQAPAGQVTDFTCTIGALAVGGTQSVTIDTASGTAGEITVFATAESTTPIPIDPNLDDNTGQVAVGVAEVFSNGAVQVLGSAGIRSVAIGDVNGDQAPDLVAGTPAGQPVQVYLSGGFRDFSTAPISIPDLGANQGVALADFNGDGNLDIAVANGGGAADRVYRGDGAGNFTNMATLNGSFGNGVAVGDFNNDGRMDIAIAATGGNPVYHGNGSGGFTFQRNLGNADSRDVASADFNGDGNDDLAFANTGSPSRVWSRGVNTTLAQLSLGDTTSVAVGQFGGSDRPDLVFGRVPAGIGDVAANPVLIANANGSFGNPVALLGNGPTLDVATGDVNRDGITDIVAINDSGVHQIWYGNASGGFNLHPEQIVARDAAAGAVGEFGFTDVNEPGGVDLAMGGFPQPGLGVFLNDGFGNLGKGDAVAPVLTLVGDASVNVPSGTAYVDGGAMAEDNIDGDITGSIVVTNNVNTAVVGSYTVTYNVSDFAGNPADPVTRTVNVTAASGTGGGGGGSVGGWSLFVLGLFALIVQVQHERARRRRVRVRIRRHRTK